MIEWRFPSNEYGEIKGINDSGVAMFRGNPLSSLAREICQNSLDAATSYPAVVEFSVFTLPMEQIRGIDDLKHSFQKCKEFWNIQKNGATKTFFENAINHANKRFCPILRISDFNTTGLKGSREEINTDWTNLTKSSGASDKTGSAGGSFGIGKYAPFACSNFSTVFYSTYDNNEEKAYQGVSRLVTFKRNDGMNTQGVGYYGNERCTPVYEEYNLDPNFSRKYGNYGTDIYILGYKYYDISWKKKIIPSLLDSFLGAIWNEQLEVNVGEEIIKKETLSNIIDKYKDELKDTVVKYYEVLTSPKTRWFEDYFMEDERALKLGILFGEADLPNKISMIRKNGMKIMDKDRLPGHIPFAGVMFINGEKINAFLRSLENPEHTKWEVNRVEDTRKAKDVIKALDHYVKTKLSSLIDEFGGEETDAAGIGYYLPDDDENSSQEILKEVISNKVLELDLSSSSATTNIDSNNPPKDYEYYPVEGEVDDKTGGGELVPGDGDQKEWFHDDGTTKNKGGRPPQDAIESGSPRYKIKYTGIEKMSSICIDKNKGRYLLIITPSNDEERGMLKIYLSGETNRFDVRVNKAILNGSLLNTNKNIISGLNFKKGHKIKLAIEINYKKLCSLEVEAYAYKE